MEILERLQVATVRLRYSELVAMTGLFYDLAVARQRRETVTVAVVPAESGPPAVCRAPLGQLFTCSTRQLITDKATRIGCLVCAIPDRKTQILGGSSTYPDPPT